MKKWLFVIVPGVLLVLFLIVYNQDMDQYHAKEAARAASIAEQKAASDAHQKEVELAARQEAEKRAADTAAENAKIAKDKEDKWNADSQKIKDETDGFTSEYNLHSKHASDLAAELDTLDKTKEQENTEDFDLLKRIEQDRVDQHTAELETQRLVEMIVRRTDDSSFTKMPPPPPPPAPAKS